MITIKLKYDVNQEYQSLILKYQRQYSSILHVFYQQLSKEQELQPEYAYLKTDHVYNPKYEIVENEDYYATYSLGKIYIVKRKEVNRRKFGFCF